MQTLSMLVVLKLKYYFIETDREWGDQAKSNYIEESERMGYLKIYFEQLASHI